jgi:alkanesulfonate monooxygenase SsuD/methylene tetrahydromethanopterin reductase-like flavin-dependent oxidoreductase (luciferase family)
VVSRPGEPEVSRPGGLEVLRTGIVLPTFRETPDDAFDAARGAFAAGVDGVFCYDHIWPMGEPDRPALAPFPVLSTLAATVDTVPTTGGGPFFGTLVARVGLVPNAVLLGQFSALEHLAPGRVIAGLGTGDRLSAAENLAYGLPFAPSTERRANMVDLARQLRDRGLTVWLAGGPRARIEEVRATGVVLNVWDAEPALVASRSQGPEAVEVTWGGPPPVASTLAETVCELADAGATWVIFGWPVDVDEVVAAARGASSRGSEAQS